MAVGLGIMLSFSIQNERQNHQLDHCGGAFEFGRGPQRELPRFVIDDRFVSRDQLWVEELPGGRLRVRNVSAHKPIMLAGGAEIPATEMRELTLPVRLTVGTTLIAIALKSEAAPARPPPSPPTARTLPSAEPTLSAPEALPNESLADEGYLSIQPVRRKDQPRLIPALGASSGALSAGTLSQWMEAVLALQRSDAAPAEFYAQAARSMIDMIGLDVGLVLLHGAGGWQVVARAARAEDDGRQSPAGREYSQTVLSQVLAEKQTFYQDLSLMNSQESLRSVDAVVVSPVFGLEDEVIGALYGLRRDGRPALVCKIQPLEAQLVQLLAAFVGANLARTTATRLRAQFEQFFPAALVRELARDPSLLEGRGQDVTILMSDLRGFSTISEHLGPRDTCRLVRDVMERLSERIAEHAGVIVSYQGDGLLAMWNAPFHQQNHATLACRAALAMLDEVPVLNDVWQPITGVPIQIGIGINSGNAQVGNTGSSRRFMYGPLGNTVNLVSRVEGVTKYLNLPVLITGFTQAQVGNAFATRRLGLARVAGIQSAFDLYELHGVTACPEWLAFRDQYEQALTMYETRQWLRTCQILLPLVEEAGPMGRYDQPTLKLVKRSFSCLESPPETFDPVMDFFGK
jgi:adenylate cyclase